MIKDLGAIIFICLLCSCSCSKQQSEENKNALNIPKEVNKLTINYDGFPKENGKLEWHEKLKTGKADISVINDAELKTNVLRVISENSSYYYQKAVDVDIDDFRYITWKWNVLKNPEGGDIRNASTNDKAIQVFLAFEGNYLMSYIWGPSAPVGHVKTISVPFVFKQKLLVLESGDKNLGKWIHVKRHIKEDFKKLFNKEAPKLGGVAIWTNSQNTKTRCEALVGPISFERE